MYIDSHAHLGDDRLYNDIEGVLTRAKKEHISQIINICTCKEDLEKDFSQYNWIYNAAAVTPHDVSEIGDSFFPIVQKYANNLVAIGETGLDYYYMTSPKELQQEFFQKHLQLAKEHNLPLIIHCRDAFNDLFDIAKGNLPTVLHCFTGTPEEARKVLDKGWYISFSGIITFKNSSKLREIVKFVPLDKILIETDCPYLAPQSHRGKCNEPSYLPEIAETIAKIKSTTIEDVAAITSNNTTTLFNL